jgi:glycosyltransferase involved in cell wall biosynthesis
MEFISAIIPAYNRAAYIAEAIESALGQTRLPDEIVVIDDGSTDRTAEIARAFGEKVRCISQQNQGIGGARNAGLSAACGDWIAFLDSDDLWLKQKLELQLTFLRANPGVDLVACHMQPFLSPEIDAASVPAFDDKIVAACTPSASLARREIYSRTGPFHASRRGGEFIEWFGRAQEKGIRHAILPEVLVRRRIHLTNTVLDRRSVHGNYASILKQQLDRRRKIERERQNPLPQNG